MFTSKAKENPKDKKPSKTVKTTTDNSGGAKKPWYKHGFVFGILGLALFLVFVSIAYSVAVIWMGTQGIVPKVMTAPMIAFDLILASIAFSKIFK